MIRKTFRRLLLDVIGVYRLLISPFMPRACRFHPSCSAYALEAIRTHGPYYGAWLAARRVVRCNPFHPGGHDPVPGTGDDMSDLNEARI